MKELLSPLVSVFNKLRFTIKFGVVIVIFMLPILFLGLMAYNGASILVKNDMHKSSGLHYLEPLRNLSTHAAQHRGLINAYLNGGGEGFKAEIMSKRAEIQADFTALKILNSTDSFLQGLSANTDVLQQRWTTLAENAFSMQPEESFKVHTTLIATILLYVQDIADATQLSTEQALDIHYLNLALIDHLPSQIEMLGQTRGFGAGRVAARSLSADQRLHLTSLTSIIKATKKSLDRDINIAFEGLPTIKQRLAMLLDKAQQASINFIDLSNNELITTNKITIDPKRYFEAGSSAISANLALYNEMIAVASDLLADRLQGEKNLQNMLIVGLVTIFVLLLYVFAALYSSLRENIELIGQNVTQLAEGNFNKLSEIHTSDELAHINKALNRLRVSVAHRVLGVLNSTVFLVEQSKDMLSLSGLARVNGEQQKTSIDEVSISISQIDAAIQDVANTTINAAGTADKANQSSGSGKKTVQIMISNIQSLCDEIQEASVVIKKLEEDSDRIGKILDVIRDIAEQTNLLALNAAIEAARAGEQGRGFAVVADEVRSLAQRTQEATLDIKNMIEQLQKGSQSATQVMLKSGNNAQKTLDQASHTGAVFTEIAGHVAGIDSITTQVATATEEQSKMAGEVNNNIINLTQLATETAKTAIDSSLASNKVASLAMEVKTLLTSFSIDEQEIETTERSLQEVEPLFVWKDDYNISVSEVNRQHQVLVRLINDLHRLIKIQGSHQSIEKALDALVQYTISHFSFEEEMFEQTQYPETESHKAKHKKLLGQITGFVRRIESGGNEQVFDELLSFLSDWLVKHIHGTDKRYAPHLNRHGIK
ncbi:MAG: bacteriohemerythrin [Gammaproteobacteria bacterium]|nr:bacteriohemerythrin [Gammaproteobacteria bacterium]